MSQDLKRPAQLLEGIVVAGLTVIGFATGQGPLFALAAAIGGNMMTTVVQEGFREWRDGWFTERGALNRDIARALCEAFKDAVHQLEQYWPEEDAYKRLKGRDPQAAALTVETLHLLGQVAETFL